MIDGAVSQSKWRFDHQHCWFSSQSESEQDRSIGKRAWSQVGSFEWATRCHRPSQIRVATSYSTGSIWLSPLLQYDRFERELNYKKWNNRMQFSLDKVNERGSRLMHNFERLHQNEFSFWAHPSRSIFWGYLSKMYDKKFLGFLRDIFRMNARIEKQGVPFGNLLFLGETKYWGNEGETKYWDWLFRHFFEDKPNFLICP